MLISHKRILLLHFYKNLGKGRHLNVKYMQIYSFNLICCHLYLVMVIAKNYHYKYRIVITSIYIIYIFTSYPKSGPLVSSSKIFCHPMIMADALYNLALIILGAVDGASWCVNTLLTMAAGRPITLL